jgi:hypothetical protein
MAGRIPARRESNIAVRGKSGTALPVQARVGLVYGAIVVTVAGFLAVIVIAALALARAPREVPVCVQALLCGLIAWQSRAIAIREHRPVGRGTILALFGVILTDIGQLLADRHLPTTVDLVTYYVGFAIICIGVGFMVAAYVGKRRLAKRRELVARLLDALRSRSPRR